MATEDTGEKFHLPIYELQWKTRDGWRYYRLQRWENYKTIVNFETRNKDEQMQ